jgi:hypothetical protein
MHTEQRQHRDLTGRYNGLDDYLREQYNDALEDIARGEYADWQIYTADEYILVNDFQLFDAVGIQEILEEESITLKDGIHRLVNTVTSRIASEILAS